MLQCGVLLPAPFSSKETNMLMTGKNLTLCLIGYDYLPDMDEAALGILSVHAKRLLAVRDSITKLATEWFGMKVTQGNSITDAPGKGALFLALQSRVDLSEKISRREPLIVLEDVFKGPRVLNSDGIFFLSQP